MCIYDFFFLGILYINFGIHIYFCIYIILLYAYICMRRRVCDDEGESENEKRQMSRKLEKGKF